MLDRNQIPPSWEVVKFGEVCEIIMGQSPPSNTYNTQEIGLPFFQGKAEFTKLHPVVEKWCNTPNKIMAIELTHQNFLNALFYTVFWQDSLRKYQITNSL